MSSLPLPLNNDAFDVESLRKQFNSSQPFPHCAVENFCDDAQMREIQREILEHLPATYKETDLFKLYQTADLPTSTLKIQKCQI